MKKILLLSDSKKFTKTAAAFIQQLKGEEPVFLIGGFAHSLSYADLAEHAAQPYMRLVVDLLAQDRDVVDENIMVFEHFCQREQIRYRVHEENSAYKIQHLITESRFADLLIVNEKLFGAKQEFEKRLNIRQILNKAECPILLLPENFERFDRIAIAYDGKKESMFALKQFRYLLPALCNLPTEIVYLSAEETACVPEMKFLKEYVHYNFSSMNISKVHIDPKDGLPAWASRQKNVLVVAGSYSRFGLSNSLSDSLIDPILNLGKLPVFLTHP